MEELIVLLLVFRCYDDISRDGKVESVVLHLTASVRDTCYLLDRLQLNFHTSKIDDNLTFDERFKSLTAIAKWKFVDNRPAWLSLLESFDGCLHSPIEKFTMAARCFHDNEISTPIVAGIEHSGDGVDLKHIQPASGVHTHVVPSITLRA